MTPVEEEFARLLHPLDDALSKQKHLAGIITQNAPSYQDFHQSGRHTPNEMAAYKKAVQDYDALQKEHKESQNLIRDASVSLDRWIPQPVHERLETGVAIYAPVLGGFIALFKKDGAYRIIKGLNQEDVERKFANHLQSTPD
jgi:predicted aminopeptidase